MDSPDDLDVIYTNLAAIKYNKCSFLILLSWANHSKPMLLIRHSSLNSNGSF